MRGLELAETFRQRHPALEVVRMAGHAAPAAGPGGALPFAARPCRIDGVIELLGGAAQQAESDERRDSTWPDRGCGQAAVAGNEEFIENLSSRKFLAI